MDHKLTFREYLDSKDCLREAVNKTPQCVAVYNVNKYCKLVLGEKHAKEYINLKPKQQIKVEWLYEDVDNPTVVGITFSGVDHKDSNQDHSTFWEGSRLLRWLGRNTKEEM